MTAKGRYPNLRLATLAERTRLQLAEYPQLRTGQAMFSALSMLRPDLAEKIIQTHLDTFYIDDHIGAFIDWIECIERSRE